jgi:hypothetical protein
MDISDDVLRDKATDAHDDKLTIRAMEGELYEAHRVILLAGSEETANRDHLWCTGACTMIRTSFTFPIQCTGTTQIQNKGTLSRERLL